MTVRSIEHRTKVPEIRKGDTVRRARRQGCRQAGRGGARHPARPRRRRPPAPATAGRRLKGGVFVVVQGLNIARKHTKPRQRSQGGPGSMPTVDPGGILDHAMPLPVEPGDGRVQPLRPPDPDRASHARQRHPGPRVQALRRAAGGEVVSGQLKERYAAEVVPALLQAVRLRNPNQVPRLEKIVVNIGLGEALTNAKAVDAAVGDIQLITGQKPIVTRAKRSIAQFRVRTGNPIGVKVTLRGERMWDFLERLTRLALPRIRDFRGVPGKSFDGRGNYSPGPPGAARLPGDRLRQGGPSPRAGDQHRDDGEDRRGVASACLSCSACPSPA